VRLDLEEDYAFRVDFGLEGVAPLRVDEPPPLGAGHGPSAKRVLAAAVGNCMAASALFCLRKARVPVEGMRVEVTGRTERNENGRLRVGGLQVRLFPAVAEADRPRMARCLEIFEDFCMVGESVRRGIDVDVAVVAADPADLAGM
jgi:uncharacterized OsmC-like protein